MLQSSIARLVARGNLQSLDAMPGASYSDRRPGVPRALGAVSSAAACPGETNEGLARIIPEWMIVATGSLPVPVDGFLAWLRSRPAFGSDAPGGLNRAAATVADSLGRK